MAEQILSSSPATCDSPLASSPPGISGPWSPVSKVSGTNGSKPCNFESEGIEGTKQVCALAW